MTDSRRVSLLERPPDAVVAWVRDAPVTAATFLEQALDLAQRLPAAGHVMNLARDRYAFTVGFVATLAAGKVNVLPPNDKPPVQAGIAETLPEMAVLHDGAEVAPGLQDVDLRSFLVDGALGRRSASTASVMEPTGPETASMNEAAPAWSRSVPALPASVLAAISYTSGSTGNAQAIAKTLGMFRGAVTLYEDAIIPRGARVVATVPAQHMYGLELASLQALWSPVAFTADKPLFPEDVRRSLEGLEAPRVLVTTPLHLRALVDSGLSFPPLQRAVCATAPLGRDLAAAAADCLGAEVLDVYGCSEAGCMATRHADREETWNPLAGLAFETFEDERAVVNAPHMDEPVPLADRLAFGEDGRFRLAGRLGDLINVAGKRGSLGEITRLLLEVPGVDDAAAFLPPTEADNQRPAAIYAGSASGAAIRAHLGRSLDAAFIPRPLIQVERLPRTDTSKLPRQELLALYRQNQRQR